MKCCHHWKKLQVKKILILSIKNTRSLLFLGAKPIDVKPEDAAQYHTPDFYLDESGFKVGIKAFVNLTLDC